MQRLEFLYLKQEDVIKAGVLDMAKAIKDMEKIFRMYVEGLVIMPKKTIFDFYGDDGVYEGHIVSMPVYAKNGMNVAGIKWAAGFVFNPARYGLPHGIDVIILSDIKSGKPLAIMDGTIITAMRTSAVNGVAAKYLARKDSKVACIIGAGVIGRTTIWALTTVFKDLEEIRLFDIKREKAEALARELNDARLKVVDCVKEAVKGSDIVITATTASRPFVSKEWLKKGCFCAQMGKKEFKEEAILGMDKLVVDNWEQIKDYERSLVSQLFKRGLIKREKILELPLIVAGRTPGRISEEERILFDSFGMACEDLAVAYRIYCEALKRGVGIWLPLWEKPLWI